jgi:predicted RNase H-like HicB family nuclease
MAMRNYPAIFIRDKGASEAAPIGVVFPDFPGCVTLGADFGNAVINANLALQSHVGAMIADGDALPGGSDFYALPDWDDLSESEVVQRQFITLNVPDEDQTVRVNVTLPQSLLDEISRVTNNRSRFLAEAAREKLQHVA